MKFLFISIFISQMALASTYNTSFENGRHEGFECSGGEITAAAMEGTWGDYICLPGEWMIKIKDHLPVTVRLASTSSAAFSLIPTIPSPPAVRAYLRHHRLRISPNGEVGLVPHY